MVSTISNYYFQKQLGNIDPISFFLNLGGALVASYPYDNTPGSSKYLFRIESICVAKIKFKAQLFMLLFISIEFPFDLVHLQCA